MGGPSGTAVKYYCADTLESTEAEICDHAAVGTAGRAVAVEPRPVMRGAPRRACDLADGEPAGLGREAIAQIDVPRTGAVRRETYPGHDLRPHLIAGTANTNARMHYDIGRIGAGTLGEVYDLLKSALGRHEPFLIDVALDRNFKPV